ncbi:MAG TPA: choice-of-anchor tandem repeat GloVer-containing protein, partial [Chthonomonadales bacterium]|nr:choice-of-anchor tandem repeat GloVer-containing protein [Chthonomonadales bacterium]
LFYGSCSVGGAGSGTIFSISSAGALTTVYTFPGAGSLGYPASPLIQASDGNLYGASQAGSSGGGEVFKLTTAGALTTLYAFTGAQDGSNPSSVVQGSDGALYGCCAASGANGTGTVFRVTTFGVFSTTYSFSALNSSGDNLDGAIPSALCAGPDGALYGFAQAGGANGNGAVFRVTIAGALSALYSFIGLPDGANPTGAPGVATDGNLFGACPSDGPNATGTIFKVVLNNRDDFNLDNHPDVGFQRTDNGNLAYWLLSGASQIGRGVFSPGNPGSVVWRFAGMGDLNGDSNVDLIWQNSSDGDVAYFLMNGVNLIPSGGVGFFSPRNPGAAAWKLVSVVDLNGDYSPDLIFQNQTTGDIGYWLMNGVTKVSGGLFSPSNPGAASWRLVAAYHNYPGAYNLVLFQNSQTGTVAYWTVNDSLQQTGHGLLTPSFPGSTAWNIVGISDLNGDGQPDILFQNSQTGVIAYWLMNGTVQSSSGLFNPSGPGSSIWKLIGAH